MDLLISLSESPMSPASMNASSLPRVRRRVPLSCAMQAAPCTCSSPMTIGQAPLGVVYETVATVGRDLFFPSRGFWGIWYYRVDSYAGIKIPDCPANQKPATSGRTSGQKIVIGDCATLASQYLAYPVIQIIKFDGTMNGS